jgi:DNA-binding CsgD family transcriptional regulator
MTTAALAERRATAAPTALRAERADGEADYELLVFPLPERHDSLRHRGGRVLVFINDPSSLAPSAAHVLALLYGLTAREAEVACQLADGHAPHAIADRLAVGPATIKSHIKAVLSKTETRRQSQLVAKVLSGVGRYLRRRG